MRKKLSAVAIAAILLLGGCGKVVPANPSQQSTPSQKVSASPPASASSPSPKASESLTKKTVTFSTFDIQKKYYNDAGGYADLILKLPKLDGNYDGISAINQFFINKEKFFYDQLPLDSLKSMNKKVEEKKDGWYRSADYKLEASFGNIISVSASLNGGAGGVSWSGIEGDTFDLNSGKKLGLSGIFKVDKETYMNLIFDTVSKKIAYDINNSQKAEKGSTYPYFFNDAYSGDGYKSIRNWNTEDFYLTKNALVVFYPKYALAAGAAGPLKFEIPYESIINILADDLAKSVKTVSSSPVSHSPAAVTAQSQPKIQ